MNDNIFEKIDKQSQTLSEVADKLDGVSIEDLYALAKRTWDYKDYEMAQKYYNHISLLRPLDWKAPFMASLCGCLERENVMEWEYRPKTVSRYYESTVAYIQNRDICEEEKNKDILQVVEITFDIWREYIRLYLIPENKTSFDKFCPNFKRELQKAFMAFIKSLDGYSADIFREKQAEICKTLADFLSDYCSKDHSVAIEKEDLEKYILPYHGDINLEENVENTVLTPEQEKEIKLKGKCYLVYKDKVIAKRVQKKAFVLTAILLFSTAYIVSVLLSQHIFLWLSIGAVAISLPAIVILLTVGIKTPKGILQNSLLNTTRHKYRLTSDGQLLCEGAFASKRLWGMLHWVASSFFLFIMTVLSAKQLLSYLWLFILLIVVELIELVCLYILAFWDYTPSRFDSVKKIEYKGKTYFFAE